MRRCIVCHAGEKTETRSSSHSVINTTGHDMDSHAECGYSVISLHYSRVDFSKLPTVIIGVSRRVHRHLIFESKHTDSIFPLYSLMQMTFWIHTTVVVSSLSSKGMQTYTQSGQPFWFTGHSRDDSFKGLNKNFVHIHELCSDLSEECESAGN